MFEVTEDNYHTFLSLHGHDPECARLVVDTWYDTEGYHNLLSVRLWVEASEMVLILNG
jgi:hypothetical protein